MSLPFHSLYYNTKNKTLTSVSKENESPSTSTPHSKTLTQQNRHRYRNEIRNSPFFLFLIFIFQERGSNWFAGRLVLVQWRPGGLSPYNVSREHLMMFLTPTRNTCYPAPVAEKTLQK